MVLYCAAKGIFGHEGTDVLHHPKKVGSSYGSLFYYNGMRVCG